MGLVDMAVTKQQLKSIVKECLLEILSEGIGKNKEASINEQTSLKSPNTSKKLQNPPRRGENVKYSQVIAETIKRESNGNSVMADIFADTAKNTLPNMLDESKHVRTTSPAGSVESVVSRHTPEELFGDEVSSKWADLAFMETQKKF